MVTDQAERTMRRRIPSVDGLLRSGPGRRASASLGRPLVKLALQGVLAEVREAAGRGAEPPADDVILARALARASRAATGLTPVINATGVILHTGLGRAPLPDVAARAAARAGRAYTDLEIDRDSGGRGRRTTRAETMLLSLTGAQAALVVNNGAAALLLALAALARRKDVLVSRGELIEIGGEFRIPDIMSASGAKLLEVGTTNRTRLIDYQRAISKNTGLVLKVHPSNYRVVGFAATPQAKDLSAAAHKAGVPFLYDLGSGLLQSYPGVPSEEPSATQALAEGSDLVCFSGDKLLGGPQAGIILGRADLMERLRKHPMARPLRVDKMQVAALEPVLRAYATGKHTELPVWDMLRQPQEEVKHRAQELAAALHGDLEGARVRRSEATVGGGSLPGHAIPSWSVAVRVAHPEAFAARLRTGRPAVFCRVDDGLALFDVRTVPAPEVPHLARAILYALEGNDGDG